jgi:hypothetical protein
VAVVHGEIAEFARKVAVAQCRAPVVHYRLAIEFTVRLSKSDPDMTMLLGPLSLNVCAYTLRATKSICARPMPESEKARVTVDSVPAESYEAICAEYCPTLPRGLTFEMLN